MARRWRPPSETSGFHAPASTRRERASTVTSMAGSLFCMWRPVEEPWQYRVLDAMPPSIDVEQLKRARCLTPTERILAMMRMMEAAEALRRGVKR